MEMEQNHQFIYLLFEIVVGYWIIIMLFFRTKVIFFENNFLDIFNYLPSHKDANLKNVKVMFFLKYILKIYHPRTFNDRMPLRGGLGVDKFTQYNSFFSLSKDQTEGKK